MPNPPYRPRNRFRTGPDVIPEGSNFARGKHEIKKVTREWIHGELTIHGFFRFCGGDGSYLTAGFSGFRGYLGYTGPLVRAILPDFWVTGD